MAGAMILGPNGQPISTTSSPGVVVVQPERAPGDIVDDRWLQERHHIEPEREPEPEPHAALYEEAVATDDAVKAATWLLAEGLHPDAIPRGPGMCICPVRARDILRTLSAQGASIMLPAGQIVTWAKDLDQVEREALGTEVSQHNVEGIPGPEDTPLTAAVRLLAHYRGLDGGTEAPPVEVVPGEPRVYSGSAPEGTVATFIDNSIAVSSDVDTGPHPGVGMHPDPAFVARSADGTRVQETLHPTTGDTPGTQQQGLGDVDV